jgi:hypothetical protein
MRALRPACALSAILIGVAPLGADEPAAIIDKALAAHGGADKVAAFKAAVWTCKGSIALLVAPAPCTVEWAVEFPSRKKEIVELDIKGVKSAFTRALDGEKGWLNLGIQPADMEPDDLAEAKEQLYATWVQMLVTVRDPALKLSALPEAKVRDRPAVGVRVACRDRRDIDLYFDKQTHLRVRSVTKVKDDVTGVEVEQETLYSDEKDFAGVKHPTRLIIRRAGKVFLDVQVVGFKALDKLAPAVFAKPQN